MSSSQHIVLITGASRGLGQETAKAIANSSSSYFVIHGYRTVKPDSTEASTETPGSTNNSIIQLDVTNGESIKAAVQHITEKYGKLDVLINNAGIAGQSPALFDNLSECISTNLLGSAHVTELFLPLLKKSSAPRLLFITSGLGSFARREDPTDIAAQAQLTGYRASKAALNMLMLCYSKDLHKYGVKVFGIEPGFLATEILGTQEMMRKMGAGEPVTGAEFILSVVKGERDAEAGKVVNRSGVTAW